MREGSTATGNKPDERLIHRDGGGANSVLAYPTMDLVIGHGLTDAALPEHNTTDNIPGATNFAQFSDASEFMTTRGDPQGTRSTHIAVALLLAHRQDHTADHSKGAFGTAGLYGQREIRIPFMRP